VRAIIANKRFIGSSPFGKSEKMQQMLHTRFRTASQELLQVVSPVVNIRRCNSKFLFNSLPKGLFHMKASPPKLHTSHLTADEKALLRCQTALDLKDRGEYFRAQEVMRPLWKGMGTQPETAGLHPTVVAEVLLCVGTLTRWIGSRNQAREAQTIAKDLITQSISAYESLGDVLKVAAARSELAYCYWREGAFGEARIWFDTALQKLTTEGTTRANALFGLAVVEWADSRFAEALRILTANARLFEKISNYTLKGAYHTQLAIVLRSLITAENRSDYIQRAIAEYQEADNYFRLARHVGFRADVKNNVGFLLYKLSRYEEAHKRIDEARQLASSLKDRVRAAQVDDTRAQVFLAEGKLAEAEAVARRAVGTLEKTDHLCLLADALITHGTALARLPAQKERANFTLNRAIEVAHYVGANNKAGLASLTLIEELLDDLKPEILSETYAKANHWLAEFQSEEVQSRLNAVARKVLAKKLPMPTQAVEKFQPCSLHDEVLKFEGTIIRRALIAVNGRISRAANLLSITRQGLAAMINTRHPELLTLRSPVRRRPRKRDAGNAA
jgi:tetratricopeptide (TPR) repeat protein